MTVLAKTCEILMSPPSHLLSLMLNVAARIAAGEWRGFVFGTGEGGERVSFEWDLDGDEEDYEDGFKGGVGRGWDGTSRGWGTGGGGGSGRWNGVDDDFWLRKRGTSTTGRKMKMVGAFPESDDDDDEDSDSEGEGEVDPLDRLDPLRIGSASASPCGGVDDTAADAEGTLTTTKTTTTTTKAATTISAGDGNDAAADGDRTPPEQEWGVD